MSTLTLNNSKRGFLIAILIMAMVMWAVPAVHASSAGHIGEKPDIGQGDGIPQSKPGIIRSGEEMEKGDASKGDDPASEGGDGIPNGGPIEGEGHSGKGDLDSSSIFGFFSYLFSF